MPKQAKKNALIYSRSANGGQNGMGTVVEQEQECRAWAETMGYEVKQAYQDIGSGMNIQRPGLQSMITTLITSATPCAVIIADRARLTRDIKEWPTILETFKDLKVELCIVAEMPTAQSA